MSSINEISKNEILNNINNVSSNSAKYIKGYSDQSALGQLSNSIIGNSLGLSQGQTDAYDPNHISDAKPEEFWYNSDGTTNSFGRDVQKKYDADTNSFKRSLHGDVDDFYYEDPFIPSFELFFDQETPLFTETYATNNSLSSFVHKYTSINNTDYDNRFKLWQEFRNTFFKIFETTLITQSSRNISNKSYYVTKIEGIDKLNNKMVKYGEDKITITLNEDVSMIGWYLAEMYNTLIYSYKNKRYMFPENVLRFNMMIKINDMRNFTIPQNNSSSSDNISTDTNNININVKNKISNKSSIIYTLNDCNFDFFASKNYGDNIEIGGYNNSVSNTPSTISFDIYYKSVERSSRFPLIVNSYTIEPHEDIIASRPSSANIASISTYVGDLQDLQSNSSVSSKGYLNGLLSKAQSTVSTIASNYVGSLETQLRETRGTVINGLLNQFTNSTNINKIEPDNVYNSDFNNPISVKNLGKQLASGLINDFVDETKSALNF